MNWNVEVNLLGLWEMGDVFFNPLWPALNHHESDMAVMMSSRGDCLRVLVTTTFLVAGSPMTFQGGDTEAPGQIGIPEVRSAKLQNTSALFQVGQDRLKIGILF